MTANVQTNSNAAALIRQVVREASLLSICTVLGNFLHYSDWYMYLSTIQYSNITVHYSTTRHWSEKAFKNKPVSQVSTENSRYLSCLQCHELNMMNQLKSAELLQLILIFFVQPYTWWYQCKTVALQKAYNKGHL